MPGATLNTPVVAASTYVLGSERIYSRNEATEGWESFEAMLGGLEGGRGGGLFVGNGGVCRRAGPTADRGAPGARGRLLPGRGWDRGGRRGAHQWRVERLPATDRRWLQRASEADMLWLESPSNPLLDVADVAGICAAPRGPRTRVVVDNTFATPLLQRPLELGADIVVHSATKLIGGHSDLLLGAAVTADAEGLRQLRAARGLYGATPGMLECFLALRGSRTLALRLRHAQASAEQLAARLAEHPAVGRVRYPGFGTIVSFELADAAAADRACSLHSDHSARHEPRRGGDLDGATGRAPWPGAHTLGLDPDEHWV